MSKLAITFIAIGLVVILAGCYDFIVFGSSALTVTIVVTISIFLVFVILRRQATTTQILLALIYLGLALSPSWDFPATWTTQEAQSWLAIFVIFTSLINITEVARNIAEQRGI